MLCRYALPPKETPMFLSKCKVQIILCQPNHSKASHSCISQTTTFPLTSQVHYYDWWIQLWTFRAWKTCYKRPTCSKKLTWWFNSLFYGWLWGDLLLNGQIAKKKRRNKGKNQSKRIRHLLRSPFHKTNDEFTKISLQKIINDKEVLFDERIQII